MRTQLFCALAAGLSGLLVGCGGSGPELTEVTGKITLDGAPVVACNVTFVPTGGGSPSYGRTDGKGEYRLMFTRDRYGALPGQHAVRLETQKLSKSEKEELRSSGEDVPEEFVPIPKKYAEDGALSAQVKSGKNTIDFELTSD